MALQNRIKKFKKSIYILLFLFSFYSFSWEVDPKISLMLNNKFSAAIDAIVFNKGRYEFGLGTSYIYENKFIPLYLINRIDIYRSKDNLKEFNVYFLDKFGLGVDNKKLSLDYFLGFGMHYRLVQVELYYNGSYHTMNKKYSSDVGLSFGLRFGDFIGKKKKTLVNKKDVDFK